MEIPETARALRERVVASLMLRSPLNRSIAWILAFVGPVVVAAGLLPFRESVGLAGFLSGALLAVVLVAVIRGLGPALVSAVFTIVLGAYFYTQPYDSVNIGDQAESVAFVGFVAVAAVAGILVDQLAGLARQQVSLRRVATLVARAASADELFAAVAAEVGQQLPPVRRVRLSRYESDQSITVIAAWPLPERGFPVGSNWTIEAGGITERIQRSGRPARIDSDAEVSGPVAENSRRLSVGAVVGVPVIVEGRVWGAMLVGTGTSRKLPADTEARLASLMDLLSTAIANAESRAELAASRARVVAAADETRRRIERDLHDGTQQRLVSLAIELRAAEGRVPADLPEAKAMFSQAAKGLAETVEDLQEISRGIHPAILSTGGLTPAIRTLARRSAVPVELDVRVERRLPPAVEVAAYYIVSEALTNVAKYAQASLVQVTVQAGDGVIELRVRDDGIGGADPGRGSGLIGLKDRVEALGGTITVSGARGEGTSIAATIPIDPRSPLDADRRAATARPG
jgi:signal transduction histidine kinase